MEWKKEGRVWGLGGQKRVHELHHAASLQALALQLPPLYPRRWKEVNGERSSGRSPGALGGRLGTRESLASHPSGWCPKLGQWKQGPQEAERRGGDVLLMLRSL